MTKRLLGIVLSAFMILTATACEQQKADVATTTFAGGDMVTTVSTSSSSTSTTDANTTIHPVQGSSAATQGKQSVNSSVSSTRSTSGTVIITASQPRPTQSVGLVDDQFPWAKPVDVPFVVEESSPRGQSIELLFSTDDYHFYRPYMTDTYFVFENGKRIAQDDLQTAVKNGTITPSQLMAVFGLDIRTKQAKDTVSGDKRAGKLYSFQSYREATVVQNDSTTFIYPPYDFIGEFYTDSAVSSQNEAGSLGYYVNATQLRVLAKAACPGRSFDKLSNAEGILVGNTLFIPQKTAEQAGIDVEVLVNKDTLQITGLVITLPQ